MSIRWDQDRRPRAFDLRAAPATAKTWRNCFFDRSRGGETTYVYLPQPVPASSGSTLGRACGAQGFGIVCIEVQALRVFPLPQRLFQRDSPASSRRSLSEVSPGSPDLLDPVGTGADVTQALFNEEGMVEVDKGAFSIEPLLFVDGRLITWADVALTQDTGARLSADPILAVADRRSDLVHHRLCDRCSEASISLHSLPNRRTARMRSAQVRLFAAIRPFQVTPTWQNWRRFGGVSRDHRVGL